MFACMIKTSLMSEDNQNNELTQDSFNVITMLD